MLPRCYGIVISIVLSTLRTSRTCWHVAEIKSSFLQFTSNIQHKHNTALLFGPFSRCSGALYTIISRKRSKSVREMQMVNYTQDDLVQ